MGYRAVMNIVAPGSHSEDAYLDNGGSLVSCFQ